MHFEIDSKEKGSAFFCATFRYISRLLRDLCNETESVILAGKGVLSAKLVKESADICKTKSVRFLRFFRGLDTAVGDGNGKG
jgi:hypothetical protein